MNNLHVIFLKERSFDKYSSIIDVVSNEYLWKWPFLYLEADNSFCFVKNVGFGFLQIGFFKFIFILGANLPYPEQFETGKSNVDCIPQS